MVAVLATSSSLGRAQFSVWQKKNFLGALSKWILGTGEAADKEKIFLFTLFPNSDQPLILTWLLVHYLTWKKNVLFLRIHTSLFKSLNNSYLFLVQGIGPWDWTMDLWTC